jgi:hypothetical protein
MVFICRRQSIFLIQVLAVFWTVVTSSLFSSRSPEFQTTSAGFQPNTGETHTKGKPHHAVPPVNEKIHGLVKRQEDESRRKKRANKKNRKADRDKPLVKSVNHEVHEMQSKIQRKPKKSGHLHMPLKIPYPVFVPSLPKR